jgi:mRNA-degrading endonuclease toxin of MazEF toxin-antitoxin module
MARILRGDIYWADLDPVRGHEQGGLLKISQIRTLAVERLRDRIGTVSSQELAKIVECLMEIVSE